MGCGRVGAYFLAEEKVATRKVTKDGQRVCKMFHLFHLNLGLFYTELQGNRRSSDVLLSFIISLIISFHCCLINPGRENTCAHTHRRHCRRGAGYRKVCQSLCNICSLWKKPGFIEHISCAGMGSTVLLGHLIQSLLPDAPISICHSFCKPTQLLGARSRKSSSDSILLGISLFCLTFQSEIKYHVLVIYHPFFPSVFVMKHL